MAEVTKSESAESLDLGLRGLRAELRASLGRPMERTTPRLLDPAVQPPCISVVVPVMNEAENVTPLMEEIHRALYGSEHFEMLFVDDCSRDTTVEAMVAARERFPMLRILRHDANCGQSAALRTGILKARGSIIVTLDGDGQNDPADIPSLLASLRAPDAPGDLRMVAGQRRRRQDSVIKKLSSKAANTIRKSLLDDGTMDTGCGLKAFYRDSFLRLPYFDHMHRYFPALMKREGFLVGFVDVNHRPRLHGRSKYGVFDRLAVAISDLLGVMWLNRRCRRPGQPIEL